MPERTRANRVDREAVGTTPSVVVVTFSPLARILVADAMPLRGTRIAFFHPPLEGGDCLARITLAEMYFDRTLPRELSAALSAPSIETGN